MCARCGKHCLGNAATGNRYRYRYYTCFTRHRYGKAECPTESLPADELDQAVLDAALAVYERPDLLELAAAALDRQTDSDQERQRQELATVEAEIAKIDATIDQYLDAFEAGSMPETQCGPRVKKLADRLAGLRSRHAELSVVIDDAAAVPPSPEDVGAVRDLLRRAPSAPPRLTKALLNAVIHEVRVESRSRIVPVIRVLSPGDMANVPQAPRGNPQAQVLGTVQGGAPSFTKYEHPSGCVGTGCHTGTTPREDSA